MSTGLASSNKLPPSSGGGGGSGVADDLTTTETDTDLVLKPDGAGGVEWGADSTTSTPRTRRINLIPTGNVAATNTDAHGSLNANAAYLNAHMHAANAADTFPVYQPVIIPTDDEQAAASDWTIHILWSSTAAGNNVKMGADIGSLKDADTAQQQIYAVATAGVAAPAVANTIKETVFTFTNLPQLSGAIGVYLNFPRTDGAVDTNTGQVSIWSCWLEYLADS